MNASGKRGARGLHQVFFDEGGAWRIDGSFASARGDEHDDVSIDDGDIVMVFGPGAVPTKSMTRIAEKMATKARPAELVVFDAAVGLPGKKGMKAPGRIEALRAKACFGLPPWAAASIVSGRIAKKGLAAPGGFDGFWNAVMDGASSLKVGKGVTILQSWDPSRQAAFARFRLRVGSVPDAHGLIMEPARIQTFEEMRACLSALRRFGKWGGLRDRFAAAKVVKEMRVDLFSEARPRAAFLALAADPMGWRWRELGAVVRHAVSDGIGTVMGRGR